MAAVVRGVRAGDAKACIALHSSGFNASAQSDFAAIINIRSSMICQIGWTNKGDRDRSGASDMTCYLIIGWRVVNFRKFVACSRLEHAGVAGWRMLQKEIAHGLYRVVHGRLRGCVSILPI
jgi:hypothetical protein